MLLKTLYRHRRESKYLLHAFVLMPEHVHLLLTPAGDVTVEHVVQLIKGSFCHEIGSIIGRRRKVWQRGFTDHRIRDRADFETHRTYVHDNPVERGLAVLAAEYRYSSAFPGFRLDELSSAAKADIVRASQLARVKLVPFPY